MTNIDYKKTLTQIETLKELLPQYSYKTLENIIQGLEARIKEADDWFAKHESTFVGFPEFDKDFILLDENDIV